MKNYLMLAFAICCEVAGSTGIKQAQEHPAWLLLTICTDGIALFILGLLLRRGMQLSVAYGIWGAGGVALTALVGTLAYGEPFTLLMGVGIVLVIAGVLLVEFGSSHDDTPTNDSTKHDIKVNDATQEVTA